MMSTQSRREHAAGRRQRTFIGRPQPSSDWHCPYCFQCYREKGMGLLVTYQPRHPYIPHRSGSWLSVCRPACIFRMMAISISCLLTLLSDQYILFHLLHHNITHTSQYRTFKFGYRTIRWRRICKTRISNLRLLSVYYYGTTGNRQDLDLRG